MSEDFNSQVIGHANKRAALARLYSKGRIPASFILAGNSGIGKKLVAHELYRSFYCEQADKPYGGCGQCKSCRLFIEQTLPYYRYLDCAEREESGVDSIRELLRSISFKTAAQQERVVILDNADYLSVQAQNILLKTLEEPRPNVYFALITAGPNKILPTIQSRCQLWYFDNLTEEQVTQLIKQCGYSSQLQAIDEDTLALLADGSMSNIKTLLEYQSEWAECRELLKQISKLELEQVFASLQKFKADKDILKIRLTIFRIMARQAMLKSNSQRKYYAWSVFLHNVVWAEHLIFERNLSAELVLQNVSMSLLQSSRFQTFTAFSHDARLLNSVTI